MSVFAETPVVLVVEDDVMMRLLSATVAEEAGFRVVYVDSAEEALRVLEVLVVAVIFADYRLPGMDGIELVTLAAQRWPAIGLIVVTGVPQLTEDRLPPGCRLLFKPYSLDTLVMHLRQLCHLD